VRTFFSLVLALLITAAVARAESSLAAVRLARQMLGNQSWTRVIRVENESRSRRYPKVVYALVFELAGLLWFYAPEDGTQSFSLHRDQLDVEKADFGPLLRDIEPGFRHWAIVPGEAESSAPSVQLPNGCFIESVCALRNRVAQGLETLRPRLLFYYFAPEARKPGHTVLMFETKDGARIIDPSDNHEELLAARFAADPLRAARMFAGGYVSSARILALEDVVTRLAGGGSPESTDAARVPDIAGSLLPRASSQPLARRASRATPSGKS
jgi:hypothetical protein